MRLIKRFSSLASLALLTAGLACAAEVPRPAPGEEYIAAASGGPVHAPAPAPPRKPGEGTGPFERLVIRGLGIDRHPHLADQYFGNYRRLVYLAQQPNAERLVAARAAAGRLGLAFELRHTGLTQLARALVFANRETVQWAG